MHRAGELTGIWVPTTEHEAVRDLVRARETSIQAVTRARLLLNSFLLRRGITYGGRSTWTQAHRRWLATLRFDEPAEQTVFQEYINHVHEAESRRDRLTQEIEMWSRLRELSRLQGESGALERHQIDER